MLIVIAGISFAVLAWLRPHITFATTLFLIPFGHLVRFTVAGVPFTFPEMAIYVLTAVMVVKHFLASFRASSEKSHAVALPNNGVRSFGCGLGMTKWWKNAWVMLPLLWALVAALSTTYSLNALRAWGIWKAYFLAPVLLFWILRALRDEIDVVRHVIVPLALGTFVVAVIAIIQRWWPIGVPYPWSMPGKFRATSVFGYPNAVGLYLAPLVPLLVGAALRGRPGGDMAPLLRYFCWITALISVLAIVLAHSTGALVALAVVLPVLIPLSGYFHARTPLPPSKLGVPDAHFHDRRNRRLANGWAAGLIGAWIVASLVLTVWLPYRHEQPKWGPPIVQKLTFQKWSGSVRLSQYRETWELLRDHPIRGAGLAGYQQAIRPYHEDPRVEIFLYPHNLLLAVWVELGLAGLLVFLAILYQFFRTVFSIQYSVFSITMVAILVHGLVDVPYFKNDLAMVFWVIVALAVVRPRRQPLRR